MKLAVSLMTAAAGTLALAGCSGASTGAAGPGAPPVAGGPGHAVRAGKATNWPTYHHDAARSGRAAGLPAAGPLAIGWSRRLDGAVYGQPVVMGNLVVAATENDSVYGLNRATGAIRWRNHVAAPLPLASQPCGNIDPIGITSTPVFYRGLVYALAQAGRTRHLLVGLDPATGKLKYRRAVPSPDGRPFYDQQRAALAAANGRIYVTFGGHAGDCGPYVGSVVGMPALGTAGKIVSYLVPSHDHAGIWAPGGPAVGPKGTVYVGVGNGDTSAPFDDSDSVTALSPALHRTGVFAPVTWISDNRQDLDLGSMTPALTQSGQILMAGKRGIAYLLNAARLGGIGGQRARITLCTAFGAAAVIRSTVIVPCNGGGPAAVLVGHSSLMVRWRGPAQADGSPVIGGGAVWVTANSSGVLYQLGMRTGRVLHSIRLGSALPHFASPSLSGRLVLVGTLRGVVAVTGA